MFTSAFILLIFTVALWYQNKYQRRNLLLSKFPSFKKVPLLHNSFEFLGKSQAQIFKVFVTMREALGPVYKITLDPFDNGLIIVADPKISEEILSKTKFMDKGHTYDVLKSWIPDGLLTSTGAKWEKRRKVLSTAFHFEMLEKHVTTMNEKAKILVEVLSNFEGGKVEIVKLISLFTLDVICGENGKVMT